MSVVTMELIVVVTIINLVPILLAKSECKIEDSDLRFSGASELYAGNSEYLEILIQKSKLS